MLPTDREVSALCPRCSRPRIGSASGRNPQAQPHEVLRHGGPCLNPESERVVMSCFRVAGEILLSPGRAAAACR
jgi:hypothetical protein